jgi:mono/diheme cytochrome c family protein
VNSIQCLIIAFVATAVVAAMVPTARAAEDLSEAKSDYGTFCVKCHGQDGKGNGPAAATLKTKPRDFTDCARMKTYSDDTLFKVIRNGGAANNLSADMPAWSQGFDDGEIHALVAFVRTFCKK